MYVCTTYQYNMKKKKRIKRYKYIARIKERKRERETTF